MHSLDLKFGLMGRFLGNQQFGSGSCYTFALTDSWLSSAIFHNCRLLVPVESPLTVAPPPLTHYFLLPPNSPATSESYDCGKMTSRIDVTKKTETKLKAVNNS